MIEAIIRWSVSNRFFVLLATAILVGVGIFAVRNTPVDAIPDLSAVQGQVQVEEPKEAQEEGLSSVLEKSSMHDMKSECLGNKVVQNGSHLTIIVNNLHFP